MSRPANPTWVVPVFAPNASYPVTADPWASSPTKVAAPGAATVGLTPRSAVSAQILNKLINDAYTTDGSAKTLLDQLVTFAGQIQALNFRQPGISAAFVHAAWNPVTRAWYGIETTTNCKASFTAGYTWGSNLITGADTLHRIASDPSGNMVITTTATTGDVIHEYKAGTNTWTRRTGALGGSSVATVGGKVLITYDAVSGLWCHVVRDTGIGFFHAVNTSSDRITWTARTLPSGNFGTSPEMATGGGNTVLITRDGATGNTKVWTSSNGGVSWTARSDIAHGFTAGNIDVISYNAADGLFMAVFGNISTPACKVYTSPDGVTWTLRVSSVTKCISKLASMGAMWVAHLSTQEVAFSLDSGVTWKGAGMTLDVPVALLASPCQLLALCTSTVFPGFMAGAGFATIL